MHDSDIPIKLEQLRIYEDDELIFDGSDPTTYTILRTPEQLAEHARRVDRHLQRLAEPVIARSQQRHHEHEHPRERSPVYCGCMRKRAALVAAIAAIAIALNAVASAQAADPFFGMFTTNLDRPIVELESDLDAQAATGVGLLREHLYWDRIERSPGSFDFNGMSALVERAAARGMTILLRPPLASRRYGTRRPVAALANRD